ncbi:NAD-dependent epimerase/dehydratase family protein [Rhodococcus opacus]|uniref:NAD-dependent epimerase/dehydratase family protein n=1 Tax=Rhodococcus opacus TaxID=37919 RepID=UPI00042F2570|nr:NAD(P)-dependent oxidoreductase [Rhodococcus opacus]AHK35815.1 UDP-glucose 4-epimerase [Rhodococcus opacus PD630]UDH01417.1 NAD(P)-dependent oxidoreductase [Rhodococcus opacus PD630]
MRVMVTGGLGVNGAWVVREFLGRGHQVAVFENRDDTSLIEDVAAQVEVVVGDISDAQQLTDAVSGLRPDCIIHLAAFVHCERDPQTAISVNIGGTANVCAAAVSAGVKRVVHSSSKAVYAPATGELGFPTYKAIAEDDHLGPIGMYGITKAAAEDVMDWYGRTSDVEFVNLRFGTIFGPGRLQRHNGPINTYSSMVELPAQGRQFTLEHGGKEGDDIVYVLDVADAIACVALAPEPLRHKAYNVAHGSVLTMDDYAAAIRRVIPDAALEVGPGLNPMNYVDPYYMALDGTRMLKEFGWRPRFDADRAVRHYYQVVKSRLEVAEA